MVAEMVDIRPCNLRHAGVCRMPLATTGDSSNPRSGRSNQQHQGQVYVVDHGVSVESIAGHTSRSRLSSV
jgi:hypothetical protein